MFLCIISSEFSDLNLKQICKYVSTILIYYCSYFVQKGKNNVLQLLRTEKLYFTKCKRTPYSCSAGLLLLLIIQKIKYKLVQNYDIFQVLFSNAVALILFLALFAQKYQFLFHVEREKCISLSTLYDESNGSCNKVIQLTLSLPRALNGP